MTEYDRPHETAKLTLLRRERKLIPLAMISCGKSTYDSDIKLSYILKLTRCFSKTPHRSLLFVLLPLSSRCSFSCPCYFHYPKGPLSVPLPKNDPSATPALLNWCYALTCIFFVFRPTQAFGWVTFFQTLLPSTSFVFQADTEVTVRDFDHINLTLEAIQTFPRWAILYASMSAGDSMP